MNILRLLSDGTYARVADGADYARPHPAKADLSQRYDSVNILLQRHKRPA